MRIYLPDSFVGTEVMHNCLLKRVKSKVKEWNDIFWPHILNWIYIYTFTLAFTLLKCIKLVPCKWLIYYLWEQNVQWVYFEYLQPFCNYLCRTAIAILTTLFLCLASCLPFIYLCHLQFKQLHWAQSSHTWLMNSVCDKCSTFPSLFDPWISSVSIF